MFFLEVALRLYMLSVHHMRLYFGCWIALCKVLSRVVQLTISILLKRNIFWLYHVLSTLLMLFWRLWFMHEKVKFTRLSGRKAFQIGRLNRLASGVFFEAQFPMIHVVKARVLQLIIGSSTCTKTSWGTELLTVHYDLGHGLRHFALKLDHCFNFRWS